MQSSPHGPHPQRPPHSHNSQPKPPTANEPVEITPVHTSGSRLLRLGWMLVGTAFVAFLLLIGATLWILHERARHPVEFTPAQNEGPEASTPRNEVESELVRANDKTTPETRPAHAAEVDRVLGQTMKPVEEENSLPPPAPPPPTASPKRQEESNPPAPPPAPSQPASEPASPTTKPTTPDSEAAFQKRSEASEEELRQHLAAVPELRLYSDLEVQNFRQVETQEQGSINTHQIAALEFAFNVRLHQSMRKAAELAGLPIQSGPNCRLDPEAASIVQTLSKDLRDMGFVSVPGTAVRVRFTSGRVAHVGGTTIGGGSPKEKIEAFQEWCDQNRVEKFRGALATLIQMLQVEGPDMRLMLVRELSKVQGAGATAALAQRALADLAPEVRQAAVAALQKRLANQYVPILLKGLRYPWPPIADHAAVALLALKPDGAVPKLVDLLDQPDPSAPFVDRRTNKPVVRELVRLNHLRNCLLCHAPSANQNDGLVRGLVPTPGQPLPKMYYASRTGNFVRADITFLRQDFSDILTVPEAKPWPKEQRYDFLTRSRPAKAEEITRTAGSYPQRDAVLHTLRGLTGKDAGDLATQWRTALGITTKTEKDATNLKANVKKQNREADKNAVPEKDVADKP